MAISKVVYGDKVLIDLTMLTVTAETLAKGVVAMNAAGELIVGTAEFGNNTPTATLGVAILGTMVLGATGGNSNADTAKLGTAKLGKMVLGVGGNIDTYASKLGTAKLGKLKLGV